MQLERQLKQDILQTTNPGIWSEEFMGLFGDRKGEIDDGLMISWFANAIETGRRAGEKEASAATP